MAEPAFDFDDIELLSDFIAEHPNLGSDGVWRWRIYNRSANGLLEAKALFKIGKRWYVSESALKAWWMEQVA